MSTAAGSQPFPLTLPDKKKPAAWIVHLWILPRWFALPCALGPVLLGYFAVGAKPGLSLVLALASATALVAALHCWNSVVDWLSGVDKPGGSVEKPYTSGSQVLPRGWAPLWAVITNALVFFALAIGLAVWLGLLVNSWWPAFGFGMAFIFGAFYSPIWKYWYMPEACGLLAFGVGGTALGMSVSGHVPIKESFLLGIAISLPFAVSWGVDQAYDAASDVQRGVRNIGGLLHVTGFPTWAYTGFGALVSYIFVIFLVAIGTLGPWAGLTILAIPAWVLCLAWLYAHDNQKLTMRFATQISYLTNPEPNYDQALTEYQKRKAQALDLGVRFGLLAILVHMVALVVAQAVS